MPDKEQKKFKVDAYLDWFEFEVFDVTKQLEDFQRPDKDDFRTKGSASRGEKL